MSECNKKKEEKNKMYTRSTSQSESLVQRTHHCRDPLFGHKPITKCRASIYTIVVAAAVLLLPMQRVRFGRRHRNSTPRKKNCIYKMKADF